MNARPYQSTALDAIWDGLQNNLNVLLVAACSAGKTFMFSKIVKHFLELNPNFSALLLMDREILVRQTHDKLMQVAPELMMDIGVACASVSSEKTHDKRITIASRQTLINLLNKFAAPNLTIVDEAHLMDVPKSNKKYEPDQYGEIITRLRQANPNMRLLGVTATPYRLGDGYIYGERNSPECQPYFDHVCHEITTKQLLAEKYLAPLVGYTAVSNDLTERLKNVTLISGEYNLGMIDALMGESRHVSSAVDVWKEKASDRKKTLAFCVTISHAEKMVEAFNDAGIPALAIHSGLSPMDNYMAMESLRNGGHKVFCSVAKLTTGMDVVDIDCLIMARPTKSAALYKQILGRGQRIAPGKTDCLVLDMVGNNAEFGTDLDNLKIDYKRTDAKGKVVSKACPGCFETLHPAVKICPHCGYKYMSPESGEYETPDMESIEYNQIMPPKKMLVCGFFPSSYYSNKSKKNLMQIRYEVREPENTREITSSIYQWLCFPDDGYSGFAVVKGRQLWDKLTGQLNIPEADRSYPASVKAAMEQESLFVAPNFVTVDFNKKFPEILSVEYETGGAEVPF